MKQAHLLPSTIILTHLWNGAHFWVWTCEFVHVKQLEWLSIDERYGIKNWFHFDRKKIHISFNVLSNSICKRNSIYFKRKSFSLMDNGAKNGWLPFHRTRAHLCNITWVFGTHFMCVYLSLSLFLTWSMHESGAQSQLNSHNRYR